MISENELIYKNLEAAHIKIMNAKTFLLGMMVSSKTFEEIKTLNHQINELSHADGLIGHAVELVRG